MTHAVSVQKPVAILTGAAGGIGRAVAKRLSENGYRIALVDIDSDGLKQLDQELGDGHHICTTDITHPDQAREMVQRTVAINGTIDVLVNNAGTVITEPFADCSMESLRHELELNYTAALAFIKEVLPHMQKAGKGTIVSVASLGGIIPLAASPGYTASKFALRGLSLSLNMTLKPYGIHVGCVCPSAVDTPMLYHEATSGGSLLNFLQTPLAPDAVAKAIVRVIQKKKMEVCVPFNEGVTSKLGGCFPSLLPKLFPVLERMGEKNRLTYLNKKEPPVSGN